MNCLRCGREFNNPVPEVVNPKGNKEIACVHWCGDCNSKVMGIIFRHTSAYRKRLMPKGGKE